MITFKTSFLSLLWRQLITKVTVCACEAVGLAKTQTLIFSPVSKPYCWKLWKHRGVLVRVWTPEQPATSKETPFILRHSKTFSDEVTSLWRTGMTRSVHYSIKSWITALPNLAFDLAVMPNALQLIKGSGLFHSADSQVTENEGDGVGYAFMFKIEICQWLIYMCISSSSRHLIICSSDGTGGQPGFIQVWECSRRTYHLFSKCTKLLLLHS